MIKQAQHHRLKSTTLAIALVLACGSSLAQQKDSALSKSGGDAKTVWQPKKLADGQPDVRGFWRAAVGGTYSLTNPRRGNDGEPDANGVPPVRDSTGKFPAKTHKPSRIIDPADGQVPYQPWARAKQQNLEANIETPTKRAYIDPQAHCFPGGVTRSQWWGGFEIRQYPGYVVFLFQAAARIIYLDGRPHAPAPIKLWMSDSRGHWEGNTLVVDVTNSNSKHRLSNEGDFASDQVHITERFKFIDANTYRYESTFDDPSVYTRPWTVASKQVRDHLDDPTDEPAWEAWEYSCIEGEHNSEKAFIGDSPSDSDLARSP